MNSRQMREMWEQTEGMGDKPMWVVTMDAQGHTYWAYCRRPSTDLQAAVDEAWTLYRRGISRKDEKWALARSHDRDVRDQRAYHEAQTLATQRMGWAMRCGTLLSRSQGCLGPGEAAATTIWRGPGDEWGAMMREKWTAPSGHKGLFLRGNP